MAASVSPSFFDFAVDQHIIVLRVIANLFRRFPQPALDHFLGILRPRAQAAAPESPATAEA